jgi:hypothetical protein
MAHAVETHPRKAYIEKELLNGTSVRTIAATLDPPIHYTALARYSRKVIRPVIQRNAERIAERIAQQTARAPVKAISKLSGVPRNSVDPDTAQIVLRETENVLRDAPIVQPYLARIAEHQQTIDAAIGFACDNEDPKAVAALVTTDLKGMEFHARLMGVNLDGQRQAATEVNLTLMLPIPRALPTAAPRQLGPADVEFSDPE